LIQHIFTSQSLETNLWHLEQITQHNYAG
jgi:hypothetical protein